MFFDGSGVVGEHWPDILVTAFIAGMGWLLKRDIAANEKRHERAEDKFEDQDDRLNEHETRITVLEKTGG